MNNVYISFTFYWKCDALDFSNAWTKEVKKRVTIINNMVTVYNNDRNDEQWIVSYFDKNGRNILKFLRRNIN